MLRVGNKFAIIVCNRNCSLWWGFTFFYFCSSAASKQLNTLMTLTSSLSLMLARAIVWIIWLSNLLLCAPFSSSLPIRKCHSLICFENSFVQKSCRLFSFCPFFYFQGMAIVMQNVSGRCLNRIVCLFVCRQQLVPAERNQLTINVNYECTHGSLINVHMNIWTKYQ